MRHPPLRSLAVFALLLLTRIILGYKGICIKQNSGLIREFPDDFSRLPRTVAEMAADREPLPPQLRRLTTGRG